MRTQQGFSAVIILIAIAIVGVVGFAGWRVYDSQQNDSSTTVTQQPADESIQTKEDVAQAEAELEAINLDEDLDPSALDEDISDLQ